MIMIPNEQLTDHFSLYDLTRTDQTADNTPGYHAYQNLRWKLAPLLEEIYTQVGPFSIISAFRSERVNDLVGGATHSHHTEGLAADLKPLYLSPEKFWVKIWQNPQLKKRIKELALKPTNVHVSVKEGGGSIEPLIQVGGNYRTLSPSEIQAMVLGENLIGGGPPAIVYATGGLALVFVMGLMAYRLKKIRK